MRQVDVWLVCASEPGWKVVIRWGSMPELGWDSGVGVWLACMVELDWDMGAWVSDWFVSLNQAEMTGYGCQMHVQIGLKLGYGVHAWIGLRWEGRYLIGLFTWIRWRQGSGQVCLAGLCAWIRLKSPFSQNMCWIWRKYCDIVSFKTSSRCPADYTIYMMVTCLPNLTEYSIVIASD